MNNFCKNLGDSLRDEFEIEVDVFISKKKKETCVHVFIKIVDFLKIFQGNN